jgi:hypothetical protein
LIFFSLAILPIKKMVLSSETFSLAAINDGSLDPFSFKNPRISSSTALTHYSKRPLNSGVAKEAMDPDSVMAPAIC